MVRKSGFTPTATTSTSAPLGDVILPDGMNLNQELVKQGWYWWYGKYAKGNTMFEGLEYETREGRKGLWTNPQPVPSWEVAAAEQVSSPW